MMHSRRARAAGHRDQLSDITPVDAHETSTTSEDERELIDLENQNDEVCRALESLERRHHDLELLNRLAAEGFTGPLWRRFAEELTRYGHAVLLAWQRTGTISQQCQRKERPIGPTPTTWTDQDRIDIATDVVVEAIITFRKNALVGGGWTFEGGASLKTFFIGACLQAYPKIYRTWRTKHEKAINQQRLLGTEDEAEGAGGPVLQSIDDPGVTTVRWHEINDGLENLPDDRTRVVVMASALGYTYKEIAKILTESEEHEVSEGVVKQILYRHRQRVKGERTT
jgi:DNA-directed RNA polymerase specialized sigma24 family protein